MTHYNLSDQVFAEARVPPTDRVAVYLGVRSAGSEGGVREGRGERGSTGKVVPLGEGREGGERQH